MGARREPARLRRADFLPLRCESEAVTVPKPEFFLLLRPGSRTGEQCAS
jgi:hypothetical protein